MLSFRVALSNSTNSPSPSSRTRFAPKPSATSRKSAPTCTVSLANAGANDLSASPMSVGPSATPSHINLIPFPSSSESSDPPISQPDRTCLLLLRESSGTPLQTRTRASSILPSPQERRKRSTARLLQPIPSPPSTNTQPQSGAEPPRKRPRLHKDSRQSKPTSLMGSSDLQFMAVVQRSVAGAVLNNQADTRNERVDRSKRSNTFEAQDELLASRLRSHLLSHGFSDADLIITHIESHTYSPTMDPDIEMHCPSATSVDMDVDVESSLEGGDAHSSSAPRPLHRPVSSPRLDRLCTSQLVATLIMRRRTQKPSRYSSRSDRIGSERRISPLIALNP